MLSDLLRTVFINIDAVIWAAEKGFKYTLNENEISSAFASAINWLGNSIYLKLYMCVNAIFRVIKRRMFLKESKQFYYL
jgi:hypothetical protein